MKKQPFFFGWRLIFAILYVGGFFCVKTLTQPYEAKPVASAAVSDRDRFDGEEEIEILPEK